MIKNGWDGSTLGFTLDALMSYLYAASFRRLIRFFRLRIVWDFIIFIVPAIVLLCMSQISAHFFSYIILSIVSAHLLVAPYLVHSWCMKGRYRFR